MQKGDPKLKYTDLITSTFNDRDKCKNYKEKKELNNKYFEIIK